jgi:hypothetical protein
MKKHLQILMCCLLFIACSKTDMDSNTKASGEKPCGTYKSGQKLFTGPEGGCYYYNSNGNKTYVERAACNC